MKISIVLPAKNEAKAIGGVLSALKEVCPDAELIVVDDASEDGTGAEAKKTADIVLRNPYSKGNGAAIKAGAKVATGDICVFMDADGQHSPSDLPRIIERMDQGYDMVVGARDRAGQASGGRALANRLYNWLASKMVGHRVEDLTSGYRVVKREEFMRYLYLLPNKFSYPTTITMAFFRAGLNVGYVPVNVLKREGKSHIKPVKDGLRFVVIIFKIATLYSPLKIFLPVSALLFSGGLLQYAYAFLSRGQFTNMSALLFLSAIFVFLVGLISEQITSLMYSKS